MLPPGPHEAQERSRPEFRYRNSDPLTLGRIVRQKVEAEGEDYLTFPYRALFNSIGARYYVLETDPYGNFIMTGYDYGSAWDWTRFGLLHVPSRDMVVVRLGPSPGGSDEYLNETIGRVLEAVSSRSLLS